MEQIFAGLTHLMPWILGIVGLWMLPGIIVGLLMIIYVSFALFMAIRESSR